MIFIYYTMHTKSNHGDDVSLDEVIKMQRCEPPGKPKEMLQAVVLRKRNKPLEEISIERPITYSRVANQADKGRSGEQV